MLRLLRSSEAVLLQDGSRGGNLGNPSHDGRVGRYFGDCRDDGGSGGSDLGDLRLVGFGLDLEGGDLRLDGGDLSLDGDTFSRSSSASPFLPSV